MSTTPATPEELTRLIQQEQTKVQFSLLQQQSQDEKNKIVMELQTRNRLLKHYVETIESAVKHIKELEGL